MPSLSEAREHYEGLVEDRTRERERNEKVCVDGKWDCPTTRAEIDAAFQSLLAAHLASLAEEPEAETETEEKAIEAGRLKWPYPYAYDEVVRPLARLIAPLLRAPLLARLRAQEEKLREVESECSVFAREADAMEAKLKDIKARLEAP